ncbi:MAG: class I SAM-dependent methyltransferase [Planctomycetes bacterium]|nr:class I SAM-dependent methyltransferase [Planctomycetota bacterium]
MTLTEIVDQWALRSSAIRSTKATWLRMRTDGRIDALIRAADPVAQAIGRALRRTRDRDLGDSRPWVERIEAERARLAADTSLVKPPGSAESGPYDDGVTIQQACGVSKTKRDALALHFLVRELAPNLGLELGTNVGISSSYIASAMRLNGRGRLVTMEGSPLRARIADGVHQNLDLRVEKVLGLFTQTLAPYVERCEPLDFVFIDGHHQYQPTLDYFAAVERKLVDGALVLFDDIRWSEGMLRAWTELARDPRFRVVVDLDRYGVCVFTRAPSRDRVHVRLKI